MEHTYNKLPESAEIFLTQLSDYIGITLLYFGSVQRNDYFEGHSDIDIDVFTENEQSTLTKMQQFMKTPSRKFKKVAWRLNHNKRMVYGYKIMYEDPKKQFDIEFSIYNNKFKEDILVEHLKKTVLPWYCTFFLIILKTMYYKLGLLPKDAFSYLKKKVLTFCIGTDDDEFISVKSNRSSDEESEEGSNDGTEDGSEERQRIK
jgi:hypothetical protein